MVVTVELFLIVWGCLGFCFSTFVEGCIIASDYFHASGLNEKKKINHHKNQFSVFFV